MKIENHPYRPLILFVVFCFALITFVLFSFISWGQTPCNGVYQKSLPKDSVISVPCENMVWMNLSTYSSYFYARKRFDSLRLALPSYQTTVDSIHSIFENRERQFEMALSIQTERYELTNQNKEEAVNEVIRLDKAYQKEIKKNVWLKRLSIALGVGLAVSLFTP